MFCINIHVECCRVQPLGPWELLIVIKMSFPLTVLSQMKLGENDGVIGLDLETGALALDFLIARGQLEAAGLAISTRGT